MNQNIWKAIAILGIVGLLIISIISVIVLFLTSKPQLSMSSCIGVLEIQGVIDLKSRESTFSYYPGAEDYAEAIRKASDNPTIKGLFVVINSPGGSVVASDVIYRELKRFNKPKVSYIEEIGASGGYYIALGTSKIYAHQNSLIGNIGVIMYLENYQGLLDKLGINITAVKSGRYKDIGSPFRNITNEELAMIQDIIDETYDQFIQILLDSRYISEELIENVTDGRIMTGNMGKKVGLIDDVGLKRDFLIKFANELGVDPNNICDITPKKQIGGLFSLYSLLSEFIYPNSYANRYRLRAE
ncbi:MAG: signal peptide peptidase SppA [Candidatus Anstonellales archaeon]